MNPLNDTAKLYQLFGGQAGDYQELRRTEQAQTAKQRWPLLAWLDLSALNVSEPPQVQVGENAKPVSRLRGAEHATTPTPPAFKPSLSSPAFQAPLKPAPVQASVAQPQPAWLSTPPPPAVTPVARPAPAARAPRSPATPAPATSAAPYLQPLMSTPARLQALGAAAAQATSPVPPIPQAPPVPPVKSAPPRPAQASVVVAKAASAGNAPNVPHKTAPAAAPIAGRAVSHGASQGLQDIFFRLAQPAGSPNTPAAATGSLWSNLSSRL